MNETFETLDDVQIGRILHFVIPSGKCRPAIVVEDWPEAGKPGYCNLVVFPDGSNDGKYGVDDHTHQYVMGEPMIGGKSMRSATDKANLPLMTGWETSVLPNHAVRAVRTWHWPRECKNLHKPAVPFVDDEKRVNHHNHAEGMKDYHNCIGCIAEQNYVKANVAL